jgi:hypothetical protein
MRTGENNHGGERGWSRCTFGKQDSVLLSVVLLGFRLATSAACAAWEGRANHHQNFITSSLCLNSRIALLFAETERELTPFQQMKL